MLDLTRPVQCRNGSRAEILSTDMGGNWPIAYRRMQLGGWLVEICSSDGYRIHTGEAQRYEGCDLVNSPAPKIRVKGFVNVYPCRGGVYLGCLNFSREKADAGAMTDRVSCIEIDIEGDPA